MAYLSELPDVTQPQAGLMLNRAGGFVHKISDFARFKRFLILGADCNTYYATAKVPSRCATPERRFCSLKLYSVRYDPDLAAIR